jgi:hypothetical protein
VLRAGNQAILRRLQAKRTIGAIDDPLEREADAAADKVMRMPDPQANPSAQPTLHRRCSDCEGPQRAATDGAMAGGEAAPPIVDAVVSGSGRPLDPVTNQFMADRFGHDFSGVRIHTDALAAQSAADIDARAYTVGRDLVFAPGQYDPGSASGRHLLAHELAHVMQQSGNGAAESTSPIRRVPARVVRSGQQLQIDLTDSRWRQKVEFAGGQTQVVYVLQDSTTGELLKVGKTDVDSIFTRFNEYVTAGNKWSRKLAVDVWTFRGRSLTKVEAFEGEMRAGLERAGARLPWDNTKNRLGRRGQGIPDLKSQSETEFIDEAEQLRVRHAPPNIPPRRGRSSREKANTEAVADEKAPNASEFEEQERQIGRRQAPAVDSEEQTVVPGPLAQGGRTPGSNSGGSSPPPAATTATPRSGGAGASGAQPEHEGGGTTPVAPVATGGSSRMAQIGMHIGLGAASVGLGLLAGWLKGRVDARIAQRQIDAFLHFTGQWINAHPEGALKKMMAAPEVTTYAWVYLRSSTITFFEASMGPEPTASDSSPIIDLATIEYVYHPVDASIPQNFLTNISGGGRHITTTRMLVIDIPLVTPSVEAMFAYAQANNIWLGGLRDFVMYRLQKSLAELQIAVNDLELRTGTQQNIDKASAQNRYWQDLANRILDAEKKQGPSAH